MRRIVIARRADLASIPLVGRGDTVYDPGITCRCSPASPVPCARRSFKDWGAAGGNGARAAQARRRRGWQSADGRHPHRGVTDGLPSVEAAAPKRSRRRPPPTSSTSCPASAIPAAGHDPHAGCTDAAPRAHRDCARYDNLRRTIDLERRISTLRLMGELNSTA